MNEQEALAQLVLPSMKRLSIWRGGVLQVMIIRSCGRACNGCTQGSQLGGKSILMTPDQARTAFESLDGYTGVVGIFGGSPSLSPHFEEICDIMRQIIPDGQRGVWSDHPHGKGDIMRRTFTPQYSNLNTHLDRDAADEFKRDWPECAPFIKGLDRDSRHGPPFVAMQDLTDGLPFPDGTVRENTESNRWELISGCEISRLWSSLIGIFRGELRAWGCEIAAAQSMLHAAEPDYPDTGLAVTPGWWRKPMSDFASQYKYHCHACGIPLRGWGALAITENHDQVSKTHASFFKPKQKDRVVELVSRHAQLGEKHLKLSTDYLSNGTDVRLPILN